MDKFKEYLEILKDLWKIPRWNALLKMGLYFIFFIVFGLIFFRNSTTKKQVINDNTIKKTNNYEFIYTINNEIIEGKKNSNITFTYNNNSYTITKDSIICDLEDCNIKYIYLFEVFQPNRLNEYINNGEVISKTEYANGNIEYKYNINDEDVKNYFDSDLSFELSVNKNIFKLNLENYNIFDKITLEYK